MATFLFVLITTTTTNSGADAQCYVLTEKSYVTINEVFVAQIETLRDRFDSFEKEDTDHAGSNVIRFNKRRYKGRNNIIIETDINEKQNGDDDNDDGERNTHVANLEYNELIGDDEVVMVDIVRKPGMKSVSRAFTRAGPRKLLHYDPTKVKLQF